MPLTYNPDVFRVNDLATAKQVILTTEDVSSEQRWTHETPYLANLIGQLLRVERDSLWLDYGCGIGRLAKEMIARYGCTVIGVDISAQMRALAPLYVDNERFVACSPAVCDHMLANGLAFDGALAVWVLQHCFRPADDIARIRRALKRDAPLFVVNNRHRAVPTREKGWVHDGVDVRALLGAEFALLQEGTPAPEHTSPVIVEHTFWATFTSRP